MHIWSLSSWSPCRPRRMSISTHPILLTFTVVWYRWSAFASHLEVSSLTLVQLYSMIDAYNKYDQLIHVYLKIRPHNTCICDQVSLVFLYMFVNASLNSTLMRIFEDTLCIDDHVWPVFLCILVNVSLNDVSMWIFEDTLCIEVDQLHKCWLYLWTHLQNQQLKGKCNKSLSVQ